MKNYNLVNQEFDMALRDVMSRPLDISTAIKLKEIKITIIAAGEAYNKVREILAKELDKAPEELAKRLNELLNTDFDCPTIKVAELGDIKITPATLFQLKDAITS